MAARKGSRGFLHIKKRTEGTSNELSFSVLDAKSNAAAESTSSPRTVSELGKVSVFTVPDKQTGEPGVSAAGFGMSRRRRAQASRVVSGGATLSPQVEIAHRKRHRRFVRALQTLCAVALAAVLFLALRPYVVGMLERQARPTTNIEAAVSLIAQTDDAILAMDSAALQPAQSSRTILSDQLASLSAATSLLDRAANSAEAVLVLENVEDGQLQLASDVKQSALARKELVEAGRAVLEQGAAAKRSADLAQRAWENVLEADKLVRQSTEALDESQASRERSTELAESALERFTEALVLERQAAAAYDQADFALYLGYIETRSAALQNALAANAAAAAGESDLENVNDQAYNEAEQKAARMAAQLSENPAQPVLDAYERAGGAADAAYQQARARAASADTALRDYLDKGE